MWKLKQFPFLFIVCSMLVFSLVAPFLVFEAKGALPYEMGFSGEFLNETYLDQIISNMTYYHMTILRFTFSRPWISSLYHYNKTLVQYVLDHTTSNVTVIVDPIHLYPPTTYQATMAVGNWSLWVNRLLEVCTDFGNNSRVWIEEVNEYAGADVDLRVQNLTNIIRAAAYNNTLIFNKLTSQAWFDINDTALNNFRQGCHYYLNSLDYSFAINQLIDAMDNHNMTGLVCTEVGAHPGEYEYFTDENVATLNSFLNVSSSLGVSSCVWLNRELLDLPEYKVHGLEIPFLHEDYWPPQEEISSENMEADILPATPPTVSYEDYGWILRCGDMKLIINSTYGWLQNFTYKDIEVLNNSLPGMGPQERGFMQYSLGNGTYSTFYYDGNQSISITNTTAALTLNYRDGGNRSIYKFYNQSSINVTYTLYANRLEMYIDSWLNWQPNVAQNVTFYMRLATHYQDWDSVLAMGGARAWAAYTQFSAADNQTYDFEYVAEKYAHQWARPLSLPYAVFVRSDCAMEVYSTNLFNHTMFKFWDDKSQHEFRTDVGLNLDGYPIPFFFTRRYGFRFNDITNNASWSQVVKDYLDRVTVQYDLTPIVQDETLWNSNAADMWTSNIDNQTLWDMCKNLSVKVIWLYGWMNASETYPVSGTWTMTSGGTMNATYLKTRIAELRAEGFKIYMYYRDELDWNVTQPVNDGWLQRRNSSSNGYYFGWALPDGHIGCRGNWANSSFVQFKINEIYSVYNYYQPDGMALDTGGPGPNMLEHYSWGSGDTWLGLFNFTWYITESLDIPIIYNAGGIILNWFTQGTLYEGPTYNSHGSFEYEMVHMFNRPAWILTTPSAAWDITWEGEIFWSKVGLAVGLNKCFNIETNPGSAVFTNATTRQTIIDLFDDFFAEAELYNVKPSYKMLYPQGNNFQQGTQFYWGCYYEDASQSVLWFISYKNGSSSTFNIPLYEYSNGTYEISSIFNTNPVTTISYNTMSIPVSPGLNDRLLIVSIAPLFPILAIIGVVGLVTMLAGPTYGIYQIKQGDYVPGIRSIVVFGFLGLGCFLAWLGVF